jgi:chemotaxis protein CheX
LTVGVFEKSKVITELLNGTQVALQTTIPLNYQLNEPAQLDKSINMQFGILIGITGDIKARLLLMGVPSTFSSVALSMYGMELEGDMLVSFSGELGNMLAGSISSHIVKSGIKTDITAPTVIQGNTMLSGYESAHHITVVFENLEGLEVILLLD